MVIEMNKQDCSCRYVFVRLKSNDIIEEALCVDDVKTSINPEIIVKLKSGIKCHAYWNENNGIFDADNVFGVCDSKIYTFRIRQGSNMKEIEINAKSYEEALKNVKNEAKKLRFKGKKVESKFDHNKLNTRE